MYLKSITNEQGERMLSSDFLAMCIFYAWDAPIIKHALTLTSYAWRNNQCVLSFDVQIMWARLAYQSESPTALQEV